jgi:hypothetical protein
MGLIQASSEALLLFGMGGYGYQIDWGDHNLSSISHRQALRILASPEGAFDIS